MGLYQKHRPTKLSRLKGNDNIKATLKEMLSNIEECPHAFFLHGMTGCGKTTLGRIIAKELGCRGNDYKEIDSADFRGIDMVREVRKQSGFKAIESTCRVWLIDECHKMTNDAQNALLKLLEDPSPHVYIILCTTEPQKVIETIKGRCSIFQVKPLEEEEMVSLLNRIAVAEDMEVGTEILELIARDSFGRPRNAINILEQMIKAPESKWKEVVEQAAAEETQAIELCRALISKKPWQDVKKILAGLKDQEAESIRRLVLAYCTSILLKNENWRAGLIMEMFIEPFYDSGFNQLLFACYSVVNTK